MHIDGDGMPVVLVATICAGEAEAFLPEHLQNVQPITQPPVVTPGPGQSDARPASAPLAEHLGVQRPGVLDEAWRDVPFAMPLHVVTDLHRAHGPMLAVNHFTLPAVSPAIKWRCSAANKITIGMLASTEPAIT